MSGDLSRPRILCLDGGGIRGLSEILILKELMLQVRLQNGLDYTPEPRQCFDVMFGTSTGGLLAVLLGRLGKTLEECEQIYRRLGSQIFSGGPAHRIARMAWKGSKHSGEGLAEVIRGHAGQEMMYEADATERGHVPVSYLGIRIAAVTFSNSRSYRSL
jgi:patatin-like phospholipase/acyl hydrolase